ncbi:MAG: hypothetical protein V1900_04075 [Candidatus Aenigmatarchaeota archaeon]
MGIFDFLKKLFKRKKEEAPPVETPAATEIPVMVTPQEEAPTPEERKQKTCPKCGAPNDEFVSKCWLCKSDI